MIPEELATRLEESGYNKIYKFNPINGETLGGNYVLLTELVEACGDVIIWKHNSGLWRADFFLDEHNGYIDESFDPEEGRTPEEAVANLWLAFNPRK